MAERGERARIPPDDERRLVQREKQISYGRNTAGFKNMYRLIASDPRLANGGVLPLLPPTADLKTTKRTWDVLARKWRRALHMFDHVFIDGEDDYTTTIEAVVELQRREWVREEWRGVDPSNRVQISAAKLLELRDAPGVLRKIPVEEDLKPFLRSPDCFDRSLTEAVEEASPQHAATLSRVRHNASISPTNCGIKLLVSKSGTAALYPVVPRAQVASPVSTSASGKVDSPTASWSGDRLPPSMALDSRFDSSPNPTARFPPQGRGGTQQQHRFRASE